MPQKNISHSYISQDTLSSLPTHFWPRWVLSFPFSSKIPYAYFLNGSTPTKKTKLHQMCYCDVRTLQTKSTMYKQCKQNSRNFAKKVLVIKLDPPKDFDKSTRLSVVTPLLKKKQPCFAECRDSNVCARSLSSVFLNVSKLHR